MVMVVGCVVRGLYKPTRSAATQPTGRVSELVARCIYWYSVRVAMRFAVVSSGERRVRGRAGRGRRGRRGAS